MLQRIVKHTILVLTPERKYQLDSESQLVPDWTGPFTAILGEVISLRSRTALLPVCRRNQKNWQSPEEHRCEAVATSRTEGTTSHYLAGRVRSSASCPNLAHFCLNICFVRFKICLSIHFFFSLKWCESLKNETKLLLKFNNWTYRGGTCIIFPVNFCKMPSISSCVILSAKNEKKKKVTPEQPQKHMRYFYSPESCERSLKFFSDKVYTIVYVL